MFFSQSFLSFNLKGFAGQLKEFISNTRIISEIPKVDLESSIYQNILRNTVICAQVS